MIVEIKVPSLGVAVKTVTVIVINKKEGDQVKKGDIIAEVESNKASFEVYAPEDGTIKAINASEKKTVNVGDVIATLETSEQGETNEKIQDPELKSVTKGVNEDKALPKKHRIYPAARKLIKKNGLDSNSITGSGPNGIITKRDVVKELEQNQTDVREEKKDFPDEVIPFTGTRKAIAEHMVNSLQTAAHVTTLAEIDMTNVINLRKEVNEELKNELNNKISPMAFVIKAVCTAIQEYPIMNSILDEEKEQIILKKSVNLSYAIDTEDGLMVPVIHNIERMNILEITTQIQELVKKANDNKLTTEDMTKGTITISNAGAFGAVSSTPIINQPQSSLVWTGAIVKKPAVVNDEIVPRDMMNLCISYDHKVIDGGTASKFGQIIRKELETPIRLLIK